jgi:hypothetical protein
VETFSTFYLVWNKSTGFTKHPHQTIESAEKEAERIASLPGNENKKVYVLKPVLRKINNPTPHMQTSVPEDKYSKLLERIEVVKKTGQDNVPRLENCPVCGNSGCEHNTWCCNSCYGDTEIRNFITARW